MVGEWLGSEEREKKELGGTVPTIHPSQLGSPGSLGDRLWLLLEGLTGWLRSGSDPQDTSSTPGVPHAILVVPSEAGPGPAGTIPRPGRGPPSHSGWGALTDEAAAARASVFWASLKFVALAWCCTKLNYGNVFRSL